MSAVAEWLVALGLVLAFFAAMHWVKSTGGKGRMGGLALALGIAFSFLFDPAKAEAMETIADRNAPRGTGSGRESG